MSTEKTTNIATVGVPTYSSPMDLSKVHGDSIFDFLTDDDRVLLDTSLENFKKLVANGEEPISFEKAGPREKVFFNANNTTAAIVTCGGLCPGINDVIRSIVMGLYYFYNIRNIIGIPYGYEGLVPAFGHGFVDLTLDRVRNIHQFGGTILGSSRGAQDISVMVDTLVENNINMLFTIGGDGTLKGASAIVEEIKKRGLEISIIGVPKTIDNDINLIDKSFGFETAFDVASPIIRDAHNEATGANNGIAIVKLMGRDSGFIAASAALSMPVVNFVLVPEMNFQLEGEHGFLTILNERLESRSHAVIVVAEGAGQHLFKDDKNEQLTDASGNAKYGDIGLYLKKKITDHFNAKNKKVTIKYIDPSYIIRSAPANPSDSVLCSRLAYHAVHGAMAGKTDFVVGVMNNSFVYLPISWVTDKRKKIDLQSEFWFAVLQSTGQPFVMN